MGPASKKVAGVGCGGIGGGGQWDDIVLIGKLQQLLGGLFD